MSLPYAADDPSANVEEPRDLRVENCVNDTVGYRLQVTAGGSSDAVTLVERREKLPEGQNPTVPDVAARERTYTVRVEAEVPDGDGSRRTITESFDWQVDADHGDAVVVITDGDVRLAYERVEDTGE